MNLLKKFLSISALTFLSRILGFVRDLIISRVFGAGALSDAFFVAFKLPNLLRRLFAEGAFSQAFVPVLSDYKNQKTEIETKTLIDYTASLLFFILLIVSILGVIFAPALVYISAPGFLNENLEKFKITVQLTRIVFPYILLISLVALSGGILNTWKHFSIPAFSPALLNISFIIMALFFAPYFDPPILVLAWAVFLGGCLQLFIQIPALIKIKKLPTLKLNLKIILKHEGVLRILKLMLPALLGVSVAQLSLLINTIFASFLENGSVSWLYYADRLMEFPTGLLGAALGTLLLPSLSAAFSKKDFLEYQKLLDWGLKLCFLLALPAAIGMAILSDALIATLFFNGAFLESDIFKTQTALLAYSFGLLALIAIKILAPGFYAQQNIKTPVKIACISLFSTQILNVLFIFIFNFKHMGLALSISIAAYINAGLLFFGLWRRKIYRPSASWLLFLLRLIFALTAMALTLYYFKGESFENVWLAIPQTQRALRLLWLIPLGVGVYFLALFMTGFQFKEFKNLKI